jgi:hypothetical protein
MANIKVQSKKWCWIATETSLGWRVKLAVGKDDIRLEGLLLSSPEEVKKIVKGGIVFVHRRTITTKKTVFNK